MAPTANSARLLARVAKGSVGRALGTDLEEYREQRGAMLDVLNALVLTGDRANLLRASEEITDAKRKDEYEVRLDVLETLIRDVWSLALGAQPERVVNADMLPQLEKIAARIESRRAARWIAEIERHRERLDVNINRKVATDALFLAMAE